MIQSERIDKINLLPEHLIDQIKAGEVIERPASLVKELLENSLDAGSTQIKITLLENGLDLIAIEDNGKGMYFEDLPYAFCRHATSKISRFEDIYNLGSYGFRGEALASMAAISRITCVSYPSDDLSNGGKIVIHGAQEKSHTQATGKKSGTSIFIKDLFYNTPARLKFIKSKTSEKNALKRIVNAFILTNPSVHFSVKWDDKEREIYRPVSESKSAERISQILFPKNASNKDLHFFSGEYEDHKVKGYTAKATSKGNAGKQQYLFINGRLFTDRQIHQTIMRNMEKAWPFGESGHYCVMLEVPPSQVDVNVHPNKTQVKFFKSNIVLSVVSASIKKFISENAAQMPTQESLISQEDQRDQSLQMFSNSPFQTYSAHSDSYFKPNRSTVFNVNDLGDRHNQKSTQSTQSLTRLDSRYLILQNNQAHQTYLIDSYKIFIQKWISDWKRNYPYEESLTTPLLISEPFELNLSIKKNLSFLKDCGLEIDQLDESTFALRTIPTSFDSYNVREVLSDLLVLCEKVKLNEDNFESFLLDTTKLVIFDNFFLSENTIFSIIENISIIDMLEQKAAVSLDSSNLAKLFK
ncbi:DNA mismatch repair endonuclease MutL [Halobacteriovorax sp. HLS]|uniref:DNA mismatch repair endonuclease MutL n=1 Tax=Halobacteriovorax sp. HLS TaxID=2234000 RepID=UPI000FDAABB6|nr:DNA mismatch repair endonuclease MutL [Halobacteriovorax sp. HLS]